MFTGFHPTRVGAFLAPLVILIAATASSAAAQPDGWRFGLVAGAHRSIPPRSAELAVPNRLELGASALRMVSRHVGLRVELTGTRRSTSWRFSYPDYFSVTTIGQAVVNIPLQLHYEVGATDKRQVAIHIGPQLGVPIGRCAFSLRGVSGFVGELPAVFDRCSRQGAGTKLDLAGQVGVLAFVPVTRARIGLGVRLTDGLTPWVPGGHRQTRHRGVSIVGAVEARRARGGT